MPDHRPGPDWARIHGTEILNPDGWRAAGIPFDQPITLDDYNRLAATSTQRPARTPTEPAAELEQANGAPTELVSPHRETGRAIRDAGGIPPGPWRVGSQCGRNLWIGPPRPHGVDVGRMDTDALAAYVVQAVNERNRLADSLREIVAELDGLIAFIRTQMAEEREAGDDASTGALRAYWTVLHHLDVTTDGDDEGIIT